MSKSDLLTVRVTPGLMQKLNKLAGQHKTTRSLLIRDLLENAEACYPIVLKEKTEKEVITEQMVRIMVQTIMENTFKNISVNLMDNFVEASKRAAVIVHAADNKANQEEKRGVISISKK